MQKLCLAFASKTSNVALKPDHAVGKIEIEAKYSLAVNILRFKLDLIIESKSFDKFEYDFLTL